MKVSASVPYVVALGFGSLAAVTTYLVSPEDAWVAAPWWWIAGCAVAVALTGRWLHRWLLTDSPSPITRRDITCRCGLRKAMGVVVMDEADAQNMRRVLCEGCWYCHYNGWHRVGREAAAPPCATAVSAVSSEPRAPVNPSAVFEGGLT